MATTKKIPTKVEPKKRHKKPKTKNNNKTKNQNLNKEKKSNNNDVIVKSNNFINFLNIHRCRKVNHMPSTITSISYLNNLIAVSRENGNIQIYYMKEKGWFLERTLYGSPESSIEQVIWVDPLIQTNSSNNGNKSNKDIDEDETELSLLYKKQISQSHVKGRLISVHLDGKIIEWDLSTGLSKSILHTGGAIWSAKLNNNQTILACGCEDGRIRFIDLTSSSSLEILRMSEKSTSRILSIAWIDDDYVISGGADSIMRKIHVGSGRFVLKMDVGGNETVVWELQTFINPETNEIGLVSGDSTGSIIWWDYVSGVPIHLMKSHEADILTIGISPNRILSAGVDRKIVQYTLDGLHAGEKRYHTHDIRSLMYISKPYDLLVSGGVDGTLTYIPLLDFPDCKITRLPTFPHNGIVNISRNGMFLGIIDKNIKIWKSSIKSNNSEQHNAKLVAKIVHHGLNISCASISDNGNKVVICDTRSIKLYSFIDGSIKMIKSNDLLTSGGALSCSITPDETKIIIGSSVDGSIKIFDSTNGNLIITLKEHLLVHECKGLNKGKWDYLRDIAISKDGQWLAIADVSSNIAVYSLDSFKLQTIIPTFNKTHTAIAFHEANLSTLIITLTNNVFHLYDVEEKQFTPWSKKNSNKLPFRLIQRKECIMGISTTSKDSNLITLYGSSFVLFVDLSKPITSRDCIISAGKKRLIKSAFSTESDSILGKRSLNNEDEESKKQKLNNSKSSKPIKDQPTEEEEYEDEFDEDDYEINFNNTNSISEAFHMEHRWGPIMALRYIDTKSNQKKERNTSLLIIERPVLSVVAGLPGAFFRQQYGT